MNISILLDNFEQLTDAPNAVAKLRQLILELAVRGRLVSQDPYDESASKLLERIHEERQQKLRKNGGSRPRVLPSISISEQPYPLPAGWAWERLGNIGETNVGLTYSPKDISSAGIPVLRSNNIQKGRLDLSNLVRVDVDPAPNVLVDVGDLFICARNGSRALVGKAALIDHLAERTAFGAFMAIFRSSINEYLYYFIASPLFRRMIDDVNTTTINQITQANLRSTIAPIPPLAEQKRIVAKVNELMQLCDVLEAKQHAKRESCVRLNNAALVPFKKAASLACEEFKQATARLSEHFYTLYESVETVGKLRSSILQLAIQGKLVVQNPNEEGADLLMERVDKERKKLIKEGKLSNKSCLPEIGDYEKEFKLPDSWCWVRLGSIVDQRLGKMLDKSKNKGVLYPYLRNTNVQWLRFDLSDIKQMKFEENELDEYKVRIGDLLICEGGEPGRCAIWEGELTPMMFQKAIHRVRPFCGISSWFLLYRLLSDAMTGNLNRHFTGATIKHFTGQELSRYVIGLPPLQEQTRIVAKVNQLMALCNDLEAKLHQAEAHSEKLMNAAVQHVLQTISSAAQVNDASQLSTW